MKIGINDVKMSIQELKIDKGAYTMSGKRSPIAEPSYDDFKSSEKVY